MLQIKDLSVSYGKNHVLKNVNLEFSTGEVHGILGMNGAGKTTLFRTIYGFKKKDKGTCIFDGKNIDSKSIALLETSPFFYSYMKGKEYLEIVAAKNPTFNIEKWNRIFDLPLDDLIDTYSTGMKKKLAFIANISLDRPVMILDEPFSGVDVESNEKIYQIIQRLKSQGKTIIISSHILESFMGICDKISVLKAGNIERTFQKDDFQILKSELKEEVRKGMEGVLNELID